MNDNQCIMMKFDDEDENTSSSSFAYGIITDMYYHQLFYDEAPRVVILADWYSPVGVDSSGLVIVKYNSNFESEKAAFLEHCEPVNLMLWPASPFDFDWSLRSSYVNPHTEFLVIHR